MQIHHVYPAEDWIEHNTDNHDVCSCVCRPRIKRIGQLSCDGGVELIGLLVIHNLVREDYVPPPRWWRRAWCWFRSFFRTT